MRKILLAAATLVVAGSAFAIGGAAPSHAATTYPWCSVQSGENESTDCSFATFAQCEAYVSGVNGSCEQNPALRGSQARYEGPIRYVAPASPAYAPSEPSDISGN